MKNAEIRCACIVAGIKLWQLATTLGYSESHFSRKLRTELPQEEKDKVMAAINKLAQEKQEAI